MTNFQEFTREDSTIIVVEYKIDGYNSPPTYSPYSGADGGDSAEFTVVSAHVKDSGLDIVLPDEEREKYEIWLSENIIDD